VVVGAADSDPPATCHVSTVRGDMAGGGRGVIIYLVTTFEFSQKGKSSFSISGCEVNIRSLSRRDPLVFPLLCVEDLLH
jgi:hypothetical protein